LRFIPSRPIKLDAGVNRHSRSDFIMHAKTETVGNSEAAASDLDSSKSRCFEPTEGGYIFD
jgi:hypothetical protein